MNESPTLSVIVALIAGTKAGLRQCLRALAHQTAPPMEVIVPYDDPCAEVATLTEEFPAVRFIRAEGLDTWQARTGASREHHNTLRAIGIRAAAGDIIALTEDHAIVADSWCEELLAALGRNASSAAVGGPVDCRSDRVLNWAVWFCDFGRYQSPLSEGPQSFMSDSNVAYRRAALEQIGAIGKETYDEVAVHTALSARGMELRAAPRAHVWQGRTGLSWQGATWERFVWGRSFGGLRARTVPPLRRALLALMSPALPALMTWRLLSITTRRRRHTSQFARALPVIVALHGMWALGECVGYVTASPQTTGR